MKNGIMNRREKEEAFLKSLETVDNFGTTNMDSDYIAESESRYSTFLERNNDLERFVIGW